MLRSNSKQYGKALWSTKFPCRCTNCLEHSTKHCVLTDNILAVSGSSRTEDGFVIMRVYSSRSHLRAVV